MAEFLAGRKKQESATEHGTEIHRRLQFIFIDGENVHGDADLIEKIRKNPEIAKFFDKDSRAEVPIAGFIDSKFYSKRIDRLVVFPQKILFLDYKTDISRARRDDYIKTMKIYARLLQGAYPGRDISGYILWLHDWELELIPLPGRGGNREAIDGVGYKEKITNEKEL